MFCFLASKFGVHGGSFTLLTRTYRIPRVKTLQRRELKWPVVWLVVSL